jgi:hypothetical protein
MAAMLAALIGRFGSVAAPLPGRSLANLHPLNVRDVRFANLVGLLYGKPNLHGRSDKCVEIRHRMSDFDEVAVGLVASIHLVQETPKWRGHQGALLIPRSGHTRPDRQQRA